MTNDGSTNVMTQLAYARTVATNSVTVTVTKRSQLHVKDVFFPITHFDFFNKSLPENRLQSLHRRVRAM